MSALGALTCPGHHPHPGRNTKNKNKRSSAAGTGADGTGTGAGQADGSHDIGTSGTATSGTVASLVPGLGSAATAPTGSPLRRPRTRQALGLGIGAEILSRTAHTGTTGHPIGTKALARWLCDSAVTLLAEDPHGAPLSLGRTRRLVSTAQRHALDIRDRNCGFPGCAVPGTWCDAHHVIPWSQGGNTDVSNMLLLCGFHHHLVHEGNHRLAWDDTGTAVRAFRPDGTEIHIEPDTASTFKLLHAAELHRERIYGR
jgi:hypothetical protein